MVRNNAIPFYVVCFVKKVVHCFLLKYGLIDRENYSNVYYYTCTHTDHIHRLKAYTKLDIKSDQAALKDTLKFILGVYTSRP